MENPTAALTDLDSAIHHATARNDTRVLSLAHTQRGILLKSQKRDAEALADFQLGAKFGNPVARDVARRENPYAKMCNAMMMEALRAEVRGP